MDKNERMVCTGYTERTVKIGKYICICLIPLCTALFIVGCTSGRTRIFPTVSLCVFTDPHYYDPSLGTTGSAFDDYVKQSKRLTAESEAILESLFDLLLSEAPEIVLVPGDLTKDGERASHLRFAEYLGQLEAAGKKVYVVPGNHDINNPHALQYSGDTTFSVASISPDEFAAIYSDYGYGEALDRDLFSLSYLAEPVDGLWILAMDSCLYRDNTDHPVTGGRFSAETVGWLTAKLEEGLALNKIVFGIMHHSTCEHFIGQKFYFPDYVLDDSASIARLFAQYGMNVIFTGHFHAQDAVKKTFADGSFILDIETGSPITYPCPYRIVSLDSSGKLTIASRRISSIAYDTGGKPFQQYARDFLEDGLDEIMASKLEESNLIPHDIAQEVAPYMASAMIAHYEGDESPSSETLELIRQLEESDSFTRRMIGTGLHNIWTDPEPEDNAFVLYLPKSL